ncbi:hypothetical protein EJ06DRAFT_52968 [Trichodelitschia bisporula]|uniref:Uncharacterized protein n=1 Tax=Trichodelitschia bisporula TaxID=703511 RepID=A0A6G1HTT5_9PEZI|nr:hypothetical protein EJ06DRAFT_52968 [Trichodelitschia bisporula]
MPAFSRGCARLPAVAALARTARPSIRSAFLHTPLAFYASKPSASKSKPTPTLPPSSVKLGSKIPPPRPSPPRPVASIAASISGPALNEKPTLISPLTVNTLSEPQPIYAAPPSRLFMLSNGTLATFFAAYAAIIFDRYYLHPPPGLSWWVPIAYAVSASALATTSAWTVGATVGRLHGITALPQGAKGELVLRLEGQYMYPWFTSKVLEVPVSQVTVQAPLSEVAPASPRKGPIEEVGILVRPFVAFGRWFGRMLGETKSGFLREHVVWVYIGGKRAWKLDTRGQAFGGAQGFDRLIKPNYEG